MAPKGPESYFLPAKASYPLLSWSQIMFVPGHKCCCWICPEGASENRVCAGCAPGTCPCNYMRTHTVTLSLCRPPGPGGKRRLGWSALLSWKRPISSATVQPAGHARQCSRTRPVRVLRSMSCLPSVHFQPLGEEPQTPSRRFRLEGLWRGRIVSPGAFRTQTGLPCPPSSQQLAALECSE